MKIYFCFMGKAKDDFKKEKKLLKNAIINKPEIYRPIGINSHGLFYDKLYERNGARFTDQQKRGIKKILRRLSKQLNGLYPTKKV